MKRLASARSRVLQYLFSASSDVGVMLFCSSSKTSSAPKTCRDHPSRMKIPHARRSPRTPPRYRTLRLLSADHSNCHPVATTRQPSCSSFLTMPDVPSLSKHTFPEGGFVNHNVHSFMRGCLTLKLSLSCSTVTTSSCPFESPFELSSVAIVGFLFSSAGSDCVSTSAIVRYLGRCIEMMDEDGRDRFGLGRNPGSAQSRNCR